MVDMNAKTGFINVDYEEVMGRFGCGVINENGSMFIEYCQTHNLAIGVSVYEHKIIHKYICTTPDGRTRNQINNIAIDRRFM